MCVSANVYVYFMSNTVPCSGWVPVPPLAGIDKLLLIVVPRLTLKHSMVAIAFEKRPNHTKAFLLRVLRDNNSSTHTLYIELNCKHSSIDSVFMSACVAPFSSFNDNTLFSWASQRMYFVGILLIVNGWKATKMYPYISINTSKYLGQ